MVPATLHTDPERSAGNPLSGETGNISREEIDVAAIDLDHLVDRSHTEHTRRVLDDLGDPVSGIETEPVGAEAFERTIESGLGERLAKAGADTSNHGRLGTPGLQEDVAGQRDVDHRCSSLWSMPRIRREPHFRATVLMSTGGMCGFRPSMGHP